MPRSPASQSLRLLRLLLLRNGALPADLRGRSIELLQDRLTLR